MAPREGHLDAMKKVFGYLKKYHRGRVVVDPSFHTPPKLLDLVDHQWTKMYPNATKEIPYDMPVPKGGTTCIMCYIDTDHAHDKITQRSVTGILLFINNTPIKWYSKCQCTVETSTYGSKMVVVHIACEMIMEIWYGLHMLGMPLDSLVLLLGDNLSVITSTTVPSSSLKKKHQAICYHRVCKCVAARIIKFAHNDTKDNLIDCLTKPLVNETFLKHISSMLFCQVDHNLSVTHEESHQDS